MITITWCPACLRMVARVSPASPAPTTPILLSITIVKFSQNCEIWSKLAWHQQLQPCSVLLYHYLVQVLQLAWMWGSLGYLTSHHHPDLFTGIVFSLLLPYEQNCHLSHLRAFVFFGHFGPERLEQGLFSRGIQSHGRMSVLGSDKNWGQWETISMTILMALYLLLCFQQYFIFDCAT